MVQELRVSGDRFWRVRDKLGRRIKTCLSDEEADREVALWDIKIDEMEESTEAIGLLRITASGLDARGSVVAGYAGYICASRVDEDMMTDLTRSRRKAIRDLSLLKIGPPTPGW